MLLRALLMLPVAILPLTACGPKDGNSTDLKYAYFKPESSIGGPLGRLEALNMGYINDFPSLRICVETGQDRITDAQIVLEAKLAYAAWLDAAGGFTESDWQRFSFVPAAKCATQDPAFSGNIVLERLENHPDQAIVSSYQEETIACKLSGAFKQCSGNGVTLGWGGPGNLNTWYLNTPSHWTKLTANSPSTTTLSPYLNWLSLDEEFNRNKTVGLTKDQRTNFHTQYQTLVAAANRPGRPYEKLR